MVWLLVGEFSSVVGVVVCSGMVSLSFELLGVFGVVSTLSVG